MSVQCTASGDTLSRNETVIGGTTSRTLAAWVRKTTSSDNAILEINYNSGVWGTSVSTFGGQMFISEFSNSTSVDYIFTFTVGQWYHVAITYDGTNARMYLDGALVQTSAWNSTGAPTGTNWNFGQSNVELQDIILYNAALSDVEITNLRAQRVPKRTSNLVGWYPLFAGSNRILDFSSNGRTLTSAGTPTDGADSAPAGWGTPSPRVILPAAGALSIVSTGTTNVTGAAAVTSAAALAPTGQVQTTGTAALTKAAALAPAGNTQVTGAVALTATVAITATGLTQVTGVATVTGGLIPAITVRSPNATRRGAVVYGTRRRLR
jgi:hypothetical protein